MPPDDVNKILREIADLTSENHESILMANKKDLKRMDSEDPKYDRLKLTEERLTAIENDLRSVADLPSPLGIELEARSVKSGLHLQKVTVPLGVVGVIFESRPNVTFDVFALCFKAGNGVVLKGSKDAEDSNIAILEVIQTVLAKYDLKDAVLLAPSDRSLMPVILEAVDIIDVIIPRGSQNLINFVRENAKVPVIETGAGIVHTYYDKSADQAKGQRIIANAKTRRVSVCNALDCLLIHQDRVADLPDLMAGLDQNFDLEVYADEESFASAEHFGTEFLSMKMSIKVVANLETALNHIDAHSSKHSEAIIAEDRETIRRFQASVDAATVYANASTAFTDGAEFGLGAEIGISTQKIHARGPMGLRELTSYKWLVTGDGQVRK
ncbi:UNVERIFIED_CONTAM: hypothetical protein GTU68_028312 [Idotea baltica]|nr:hypothetical protein [Idotea baltica]